MFEFEFEEEPEAELQEEPEAELEEEEDEEEFEDAEDDSEPEVVQPAPRRSARGNLGQPPVRLNDYVTYKTNERRTDGEPRTYKEAMNSRKASHWKRGMEEELKAIEENKTWEMADLPNGRRAIGCKCSRKRRTETETW